MTDRSDRDPDPPTAQRRRRRPGAGEVIGNALVGFDYAVFRATKPPAIMVEAAKPVRGLSGEGGHLLSIDFAEDAPDPDVADPAVPPLASEDGLE